MMKKMSFSYEDPRTLQANTWNPNEMTAEAEAKLRNSLEINGHVRPILVRELEDGTKEIVGGMHRVEVSIDLGHETVPVINLGRISDDAAKKALLLDNARYGENDAGKLSDLLQEIGTADELSHWLDMDLTDLESLIGVEEADDAELAMLGDLDDFDDEDDLPTPVKELKTHQPMKFKVPVEDAEFVKDTIEKIIKEQGIEDSDSSIRAGEAVLWLCRNHAQESVENSLTPDDFDPDEFGLE